MDKQTFRKTVKPYFSDKESNYWNNFIGKLLNTNR